MRLHLSGLGVAGGTAPSPGESVSIVVRLLDSPASVPLEMLRVILTVPAASARRTQHSSLFEVLTNSSFLAIRLVLRERASNEFECAYTPLYTGEYQLQLYVGSVALLAAPLGVHWRIDPRALRPLSSALHVVAQSAPTSAPLTVLVRELVLRDSLLHDLRTTVASAAEAHAHAVLVLRERALERFGAQRDHLLALRALWQTKHGAPSPAPPSPPHVDSSAVVSQEVALEWLARARDKFLAQRNHLVRLHAALLEAQNDRAQAIRNVVTKARAKFVAQCAKLRALGDAVHRAQHEAHKEFKKRAKQKFEAQRARLVAQSALMQRVLVERDEAQRQLIHAHSRIAELENALAEERTARVRYDEASHSQVVALQEQLRLLEAQLSSERSARNALQCTLDTVSSEHAGCEQRYQQRLKERDDAHRQRVHALKSQARAKFISQRTRLQHLSAALLGAQTTIEAAEKARAEAVAVADSEARARLAAETEARAAKSAAAAAESSLAAVMEAHATAESQWHTERKAAEELSQELTRRVHELETRSADERQIARERMRTLRARAQTKFNAQRARLLALAASVETLKATLQTRVKSVKQRALHVFTRQRAHLQRLAHEHAHLLAQWERIQCDLSAELDSVRAQWAQARADADSELALEKAAHTTTQEELRRLETQHAQTLAALQDMEARLALATQSTRESDAREELSHLRDSLHALEAQRDDAHRTAEQAQFELAQLRESHRSLEAQHQETQVEAAQLRESLRALETQHQETQHQEAQAEALQLRETVQVLELQLQEAQRVAEVAQTETMQLREAVRALEDAQGEWQHLHAHVEALHAAIAERDAALHALTEAHAAEHAQSMHLQHELQLLRDELQHLHAEKEARQNLSNNPPTAAPDAAAREREDLAALQVQLQDRAQEVDALRAHASALLTALQERDMALQAAHEEAARLLQRLEETQALQRSASASDSDETRTQHEAALYALELKLQARTHDCSQLQAQLRDLETHSAQELAQLRAQLEECTRELTHTQDALLEAQKSAVAPATPPSATAARELRADEGLAVLAALREERAMLLEQVNEQGVKLEKLLKERSDWATYYSTHDVTQSELLDALRSEKKELSTLLFAKTRALEALAQENRRLHLLLSSAPVPAHTPIPTPASPARATTEGIAFSVPATPEKPASAAPSTPATPATPAAQEAAGAAGSWLGGVWRFLGSEQKTRVNEQ